MNINDLFTQEVTEQLSFHDGRSTRVDAWLENVETKNILDVAPLIQELHFKARKLPQFRGLKLCPVGSRNPRTNCYEQAIMYFEGDEFVVAMVRRNDTRRSNKPSYQLELPTAMDNLNSVDVNKLLKRLRDGGRRITKEHVSLRDMYTHGATYKNKLSNAEDVQSRAQRNIDTALLVQLFKHLDDIGVRIPNHQLAEQAAEAIAKHDEYVALRDTHDKTLVVRKHGDLYMVGAITDACSSISNRYWIRSPIDIRGATVCTMDEIPLPIQMKVSSLSILDNDTLVEGIGYKADESTYYVAMGADYEV